MTRNYPDPALIAAARLIENLATKIQQARARIREQIDDIDGWTGNSDAPKVTHTAELTPVESAAAQRLRLQWTIDDLEAHCRAIARIAHNACVDADRIIGTRVEVPRCDGGIGREGYLEWGRPDCTNVPGPSRRQCDRCRQAEYRWRREHDLAPRGDDAA